jgi:hypothetical protein
MNTARPVDLLQPISPYFAPSNFPAPHTMPSTDPGRATRSRRQRLSQNTGDDGSTISAQNGRETIRFVQIRVFDRRPGGPEDNSPGQAQPGVEPEFDREPRQGRRIAHGNGRFPACPTDDSGEPVPWLRRSSLRTETLIREPGSRRSIFQRPDPRRVVSAFHPESPHPN